MPHVSSRARRLGAALTAAAVCVLGLVAAPTDAQALPTSTGAAAHPASAVAAPTAPGAVVSLTPARVMDTRNGTNVRKGQVPAGGSVTLAVLGKGGLPTSGVAAVLLNVTVVGAAGSGYLTVYPGGTTPPGASNLNYTAGAAVPNLVLAKLGAGGTVGFTASSSAGDVIADVAGYVVDGTPTTAGAVVPLPPARVMDTRSGVGVRKGAVPAGGTVALPVLGAGGVPTSGVAAVVLNVTVTNTAGGGYVTVHPDGTSTPTASNLNYAARQTIPNLVLAKVGTGGRVDVSVAGAATDVIADVAGYVLSGVATQPGALVPTAPARVLDTRGGVGVRTGPVAAGTSVALPVLGRGGVPSTGVAAVVLNVTVTGPTGAGYLTVFPGATTQPGASNLNFVRGQTVPNLVLVPVGADGTVAFGAVGSSTQVIADVAGFVLSTPRTPPAAVTGLTATPSATAVTLTWTDAASTTGSTVRRALGTTPPATADDGTLVADLATPGATVTDRGLTPSTAYAYAVFSHGEGQLYGAAATVTTTTSAPTGLGSLVGLVTDAGGTHHALAGAAVVVSSASLGTRYTTTTAADGAWALDGVKPGTDYQVCANGWSATGGSSDGVGYLFGCAHGEVDFGTVPVAADALTSGLSIALSAGGAVTGTVSDTTRAGAAVAGVRVSVSSYAAQSLSGQPTATTDASGHYTVRGLPNDAYYQVCFDPSSASGGGAAGYAQQCYDHRPTAGQALLQMVLAGRTLSGVDAGLVAGGALSGRVVDATTQQELAGAQVSVVLAFTTVGTAVTASDGSWTVPGLAPGTQYTVFVQAASATGGSSDASGYQDTFLGGSSTPTTVSVTAGSTTSGLVVPVSPGGALLAVVKDASGHPLANVGMNLQSQQANRYAFSDVARTGADGTILVKGLQPATDYQVCFHTRTSRLVTGGSSDATGYQGECWNNQPLNATATAVTVRAGAATQLPVALAAGGAISGRVTDAAGTHAGLAGVKLSVSGGVSDDTATMVVTRADGTWTVRGLAPATSYTVCFDPDQSVYGGSTDATGYVAQCYKGQPLGGTPTPVSVSAGVTRTGVDVSLPTGGALTGQVTEKAGAHLPLQGVDLIVSSDLGRAFVPATVGADGRYTVRNLAAATDYTLCFSPSKSVGGGSNDALGYQASCYLDKPDPSTATKVAVIAGQTRTVSQSLATAGAVTGTVTQDGGSGHGLGGVQVSVFVTNGPGAGSSTTTDAQGHFTVRGLAARTDYVVCFAPAPGATYGGTTDTAGYAQECYDNVPDLTTAKKVTVTAGTALTVNAALATDPNPPTPAAARAAWAAHQRTLRAGA